MDEKKVYFGRPKKIIVDFYFNGLKAFYPGLVLSQKEAEKVPLVEIWRGIERLDFVSLVLARTLRDDLAEAVGVVLAWRKEYQDEEKKDTKAEKPQQEELNQTVPNNLDELVEDLEELEAKKKEEKLSEDEKVQQGRRIKDIPQEIEEITKESESAGQETTETTPKRTVPEEKAIYIQAKEDTPPVVLNPPEQKRLDLLVRSANLDPRGFTDHVVRRIILSLPKSIVESIPKEKLELTVKILATNFTDALLSGKAEKGNLAYALATLANPENPVIAQTTPDPKQAENLSTAAQEFALFEEADLRAKKVFLGQVIDKRILDHIYGPDQKEYQATSERTEKSEFEIKPDEIFDIYKRFREARKTFFEAIKTGDIKVVTDYAKTSLEKIRKLSPWYAKPVRSGILGIPQSVSSYFARAAAMVTGVTIGVQTASLASQWANQGIPLRLSSGISGLIGPAGGFSGALSAAEAASMVDGVLIKVIYQKSFGDLSLKIALASQGGQKAVAVAIEAGAAKALAWTASTAITGAVTAVSETLAAIGAALGEFATPVFAIIGAIIGWIVGKIVEKLIGFLQEHKEDIKNLIGIALTTIGLVLGGGLGGALLLGGIGTLAIGGGLGVGLAGAGSMVGSFFLGISTMFIKSVAKPIIFSLIIIPVVIALIVFIINSGAYIVPPDQSLTTGLIVSPYIDVQKTANPAGPFRNGESPTIEYTVTVTAKQGVLTHIRFSYACSATKQNNAPDCMTIKPPLPPAPASISPGQPYTLKYTQKYDSPGYDDTFIVDTFTVIADAPEQVDAQAAASATVKIGNPPEECPRDWPILPEGSERGLMVTQTANGPYSHRGDEALDIGAAPGHNVTARHSGIANVYNIGALGKHVIVHSNCDGRNFSSVYAHLSVVSVRNGEQVTFSQSVGKSGNTGATSGPHLHYEFLDLGANSMNNPRYIPKTFPRGCANDATGCGSIP